MTIASIILLNEERTHFIQEVWSGHIDLDLPAGLPWPVTVGARAAARAPEKAS